MPTQVEVAEHLFMAQKTASEFLNAAGIDWREMPLNEIRRIYIERLRGQASGHSTAGADLVMERVQTERLTRELRMLELAEKRAQLINVSELEPELIQMFSGFKAELLALPAKLKAALDALHGIDIDIQYLNEAVCATLTHLSQYEASEPDADPALVQTTGAT
ncbi:MarR family transcriptional regulator [Massilia sp. W12]|uniref:MarR family transcriptional regulator n=1 Tax=Massilia sp. W12 TaxID=3126507 RepID=UPI0030D5E4B3